MKNKKPQLQSEIVVYGKLENFQFKKKLLRLW